MGAPPLRIRSGTAASSPGPMGATSPLRRPAKPSRYATTFTSGIISRVGSELANARNVQGQREAIVADLDALSERLHGVDLDEEATNLIAYQSAYQAAARVISTSNSMMGVLLDLV